MFLLILITSYLLTVPHAYNNYYVDDLSKSKYNIIITGPLTEYVYKELSNNNDIKEICGAYVITTSISNGLQEHVSHVYITDNIDKFKDLSIFNNHALKNGKFINGQVIISNDISKHLGIYVGDRILIELGEGGVQEFNVSGILKNTAYTHNIVILASNKHLEEIDQNIKYTILYIYYNYASDVQMLAETLNSHLTNTNPSLIIYDKASQLKEIQNISLEIRQSSYKYMIISIVLLIGTIVHLNKKYKEKDKIAQAIIFFTLGSLIILYSTMY